MSSSCACVLVTRYRRHGWCTCTRDGFPPPILHSRLCTLFRCAWTSVQKEHGGAPHTRAPRHRHRAPVRGIRIIQAITRGCPPPTRHPTPHARHDGGRGATRHTVCAQTRGARHTDWASGPPQPPHITQVTATTKLIFAEVREFIKDTRPKTNTTRGGRKAHRPRLAKPKVLSAYVTDTV